MGSAHYRAKVEVHLSCTHVWYWRDTPPKVGERVYCKTCDNMIVVIGKTGTWVARCGRCTFLQRRAGYETILTIVRRHLRTCPLHVINLSQIGSTKHYSIKLDKQDTLGPTLSEVESPDVLPLT